MSEALIFASANPKYNNRVFIELQAQFMKIPSSEHGENLLCTEVVLNVKNNLSSYCGLADAKIRASDKDLPVIPGKCS